MTLYSPSRARNLSSVPETRPGASAPPHQPVVNCGLVGGSSAMRALHADIARFGPRAVTVLVTGETGTGKELVARALHDASPRARAPFVALNVATLRRELLASELFGHTRGAFTGAVENRRGLFEQAHGGTLFLDEIGELDARAQAELLRVLETREVRPLGSERSRAVDVRVVAATHRDLASMVAEGAFREDLYYRLHVLTITTPPLRERNEDIPELAAHLLARQRDEVGPRVLSRDAIALLRAYAWPGNVRQLLNVLCRATARCDDEHLDASVIADALRCEPQSVALPRNGIDDFTIDAALHASGGSVAGAARRMGIARSTLRDRLRARAACAIPTLLGPPRRLSA